MSHAQNTSAPQPNVFLTRIHRLLFTSKELWAFTSSSYCQGHLKTPELPSVLYRLDCGLLISDAQCSVRSHLVVEIRERTL
jgi:hypothetical protein